MCAFVDQVLSLPPTLVSTDRQGGVVAILYAIQSLRDY